MTLKIKQVVTFELETSGEREEYGFSKNMSIKKMEKIIKEAATNYPLPIVEEGGLVSVNVMITEEK